MVSSTGKCSVWHWSYSTRLRQEPNHQWTYLERSEPVSMHTLPPNQAVAMLIQWGEHQCSSHSNSSSNNLFLLSQMNPLEVVCNRIHSKCNNNNNLSKCSSNSSNHRLHSSNLSSSLSNPSNLRRFKNQRMILQTSCHLQCQMNQQNQVSWIWVEVRQLMTS